MRGFFTRPFKAVLIAALCVAGVVGPANSASALGGRRSHCAPACYVPCYQPCYVPCYQPCYVPCYPCPPCYYYYVVSYWDCYRCCWVYYGTYWNCWEAQQVVCWLRCCGFCATYCCYPWYPYAQGQGGYGMQAAPSMQGAPSVQAAPAPVMAPPAPAKAAPALH